ncbi:GGDEF domain-containing protein [Rhizobium sp. LjRoot30]|uniref:GGDEF domain-containing protein n=1 Tax=Rhizobium sp. LjRoot30 TaxID=3342320 RepID=UPI003ED0EFDD
MSLDYNSLLLATGFSAGCLGVTLLGSWVAARSERFLLTWACGTFCVVATVFTYSAYAEYRDNALLIATYIFLTGGFAFVYGAAYQFRTRRLPMPRVLLAVIIPTVIAIPAFVMEWNGVTIILMNVFATTLLLLTALEHARNYKEAPTPVLALTVLYSLVGLSFALCAAVLIADGKLVIAGPPQNWAETVNLIACIAGLSSIGALSFGLNQWRLAQVHKKEATTDALTGLLNRRALFDRYSNRVIGPDTAVVLFDLDMFKAINDRYGHAVGDEVLKMFARQIELHSRTTDAAVRLGGEEFALVLDGVKPGVAERIAENIRTAFSTHDIHIDGGTIRATVSAGIAFGTEGGLSLDAVLNASDKALYAAKHEGRNRVSVSNYLWAV